MYHPSSPFGVLLEEMRWDETPGEITKAWASVIKKASSNLCRLYFHEHEYNSCCSAVNSCYMSTLSTQITLVDLGLLVYGFERGKKEQIYWRARHVVPYTLLFSHSSGHTCTSFENFIRVRLVCMWAESQSCFWSIGNAITNWQMIDGLLKCIARAILSMVWSYPDNYANTLALHVYICLRLFTTQLDRAADINIQQNH